MNTDALKRYAWYIRQIGNAALCLDKWANNFGDAEPDAVTWADVGTAAKAYDGLKELCAFLNIRMEDI